MSFSPLSQQLTLPLRFPEEQQLEAIFGSANRKLIQNLHTALFKRPSFELFYIYGKSGLGKTHFLKALCIEGLKLGKSCAYIPLHERQTISLSTLSELENYDLLVMDDLQAIVRDSAWQTAIFELYNQLWMRAETKFLIAATAAPLELNLTLPDLLSRLYGGHLSALTTLSQAEMLEALQYRAQMRGLRLSSQAGQFLIKRLGSDQKQLFDEWKLLDARSFQSKHRITIPFIKRILKTLS